MVAEKAFELFCIKHNIECWKSISNQTLEDYIIYYKNGFKRINIKYRSVNEKRKTMGIQLVSKSGGTINVNYLETPLDYVIVTCDVALTYNTWLLVDLHKYRQGDLHIKYPSITLAEDFLRELVVKNAGTITKIN